MPLESRDRNRRSDWMLWQPQCATASDGPQRGFANCSKRIVRNLNLDRQIHSVAYYSRNRLVLCMCEFGRDCHHQITQLSQFFIVFWQPQVRSGRARCSRTRIFCPNH